METYWDTTNHIALSTGNLTVCYGNHNVTRGNSCGATRVLLYEVKEKVEPLYAEFFRRLPFISDLACTGTPFKSPKEACSACTFCLLFFKVFQRDICLSDLSICLSICLFVCLSVSIHPPIYPSIHLSIYSSIHLSIRLDLPTYLFVYLSIYLSIFLSIYLAMDLSIDLSVYRSIYRSINRSIYRSIYKSIIDLSIHLFVSIYR